MMDSNIELRHSLSLSFTADDGASQDVPVQLVLTHNASDFSEVAVHCASRSHEGVETRVLLTTSRNFSPDRRKLLGLHMQSTACLNRFGPEDLVYFWADYGSRVDLLAVKVGFEESNAGMPSNVMDAEASPGETLGRSVPPIKCSPCDVLYSFEVAKLLANVTDGNINVKNSHLTLLKVEATSTPFGVDSAVFLHFSLGLSEGIATYVLDAINLLALTEKRRKGESSSDIVPMLPPLIIPRDVIHSARPNAAPAISDSNRLPDIYFVRSSITAHRVYSPSVPSGALSIGYTIAVSFKDTERTNGPIYGRMVTLEHQVASLLGEDAGHILNNPDADVTLPLPRNLSSSGASGFMERNNMNCAVETRMEVGLVEVASGASNFAATRRANTSMKLWKLCLDLGMIWLERRIRIDALQDQLVAAPSDQQMMSKKSFRRLILLEVMASNGLAHCIADYITAVATPPENSRKIRTVDSSSVSSEYVLRDVTRIHQWTVTLLEQLSAFGKDQILRDFVVPFLYAKSSGIGSIRDLPVLNMQEINTCIALCQTAVAIFEALIMRKISEVSSLIPSHKSDATASNRGAAYTSSKAVIFQHTGLLEGQRQVAAALLGSLRVARLACASPRISLPSITPADRTSSSDSAANTEGKSEHAWAHIEIDFNRRTTVAPELDYALKLLEVDGYCTTPSYSTPKTSSRFLTFADRIASILGISTPSIASKARPEGPLLHPEEAFISLLLSSDGPALRGVARERAAMQRYIDRLTAVLFSPVEAARTQSASPQVDDRHLHSTRGNTAASSGNAYPVTVAFANVLHVLLESFGGMDFTPSEVMGFATDFSVACNYSYVIICSDGSSGSEGRTIDASAFPRRIASVLTALWLLDYGDPACSPTAVLELLRLGFDLGVVSTTDIASYGQGRGAIVPTIDVARHAIARLLVNSQWRPVLTVINYFFPNSTMRALSSKSRTLSGNSLHLTSDSECNAWVLFGSLAAGAAMLEVDDWRDAWHYARSLLERASTSGSFATAGNLQRVASLFISRLCADGRLNEFVGATYPIQDQVVLESELRLRVSQYISGTSRGPTTTTTTTSGSKATTGGVSADVGLACASALILFLLHQHRLPEAISTTRWVIHAASPSIALPPGVLQLVQEAERFPPSILNGTRPIVAPRSDADMCGVEHDGISSFENILRELREQSLSP